MTSKSNEQKPLAIELASDADISALPQINFSGQIVLTTELVAQFFGCESIHIQQNFINNKNRFELEKHYFDVTGNDLKSFKNQLLEQGYSIISSKLKFVPKLTLWTKRGAILLAKILDTDQAWSVIDKLVDFYFDRVEVKKTKNTTVIEPKSSLKYSLKFIADETAGADFLAKYVGLSGNQAILSTCQMIRKTYDVDILSLTRQKGLISESQQHDFSPTEIGGMLKPIQSARKVNQLLIELGYQTREQNPKLNRVVYQPTDLAKSFAILKDTLKKYSDGTPILQLR